jgi:hypothetical protein
MSSRGTAAAANHDGPLPLWLLAIPDTSCAKAASAIAPLATATAPPNRPELARNLPLSSAYLAELARKVREQVLAAPPMGASPTTPSTAGPVNVEQMTMIGIYASNEHVRSIANAWVGDGRVASQGMAPVAPAYKLLLRSLYACEHLMYRGPAVRVLDAREPGTRAHHLFNNYATALAMHSSLNFYDFVNFESDADGAKLNARIEAAFSNNDETAVPQILVSCDNVVGYDISAFMPARDDGGGSDEDDRGCGESIVVPCPSFFKITSVPRRINNTVFIDVHYDKTTSISQCYLPRTEHYWRQLEAIRQAPTSSAAYYNLAVALAAKEEVELLDGRVVTRRHLFIEAIRHDSQFDKAYAKLSDQMKSYEELTLADGRMFMKREMSFEADLCRIRQNPLNAAPYCELADKLVGDETIALTPRGPLFTKMQLYEMALERDKTCCVAYNAIGFLLLGTHDCCSRMRREMFYTAVKLNPAYSAAYCNLANEMGSIEKITMPDCRTVMTKRQLYIEAIKHDPTYTEAYTRLATLLSTRARETVRLPNKRTVGAAELYVEALLTKIRRNPSDGSAYRELASRLSATETVDLGNGRQLTKVQIYIEAIQHDPTDSATFSALAASLSADDAIALRDGRSLTKRQLYALAIKHAKWWISPSADYFALAGELSSLETIRLADGRSLSKRGLIVEAIRHKHWFQSCGEEYFLLANELGANEAVKLPNGRVCTKRDLYVAAIKDDKTCSEAYVALAGKLRGDRVRLHDGRQMQSRDLYVEAIRYDPTLCAPYYQLSHLLNPHNNADVVTLHDGRSVTRRQLLQMAAKCDPNKHQQGCSCS